MVLDSLGFLPPPKEGESMTNVANQVLRELRTRSFISDDLDFGVDSLYIGKGEFERVDRRNPKISENAQHLVFEENNFYGEDLVPTGVRSVVFRNGGNDIDFLNTRVCLSTLILSGCTNLRKLPKGMKNLVSLRQLAITTAQADFPKELIANLTSLENLSFTECDNLESLFEGVQLSTVKSLILSECGSLKSVSLHAFRNLEFLMIADCIKLELSMNLSCQIPDSKLKYLFLDDLPQLVKLPQSFQGSANTLQHLSISDCVNLDELPEWLPTLICLKVLDIDSCPKLLSLPNIHHLTNLENLEIVDCPELCRRFKPEVGQDWHKISHIKIVHIEDSDTEEELSE
ncbi:uncharacterized protein HKW66_Vig0187040 [Vigna angularis]|uniref:Uncharacterized protein n=1 Tax=Phaseolus angularis TaxID=3914 RepID=A0A8T0KTY6_PHAAN|nr:uncharacterized protein HKW66_Vig0187040 [Vigna angularis]